MEEKRKRLSRAERSEQILEVSKKLFAEKGYENATIKEIAAQCGITEAFVLRHFPSKDAIWMALYERWVGKMKEVRLPELTGHSAAEMLMHLALQWIEGHHVDPETELLRRAIESRHNVDQLILDGVRSSPDFTTTRLLPVVLLGQQTGEFRRDDPFQLAKTFYVCMVGLSSLRHTFPDRYENYPQILEACLGLLKNAETRPNE